jgi:hypothetical protein
MAVGCAVDAQRIAQRTRKLRVEFNADWRVQRLARRNRGLQITEDPAKELARLVERRLERQGPLKRGLRFLVAALEPRGDAGPEIQS